MALKTDYKDAVFSGARKYTESTNDDGTKSFADATVYTQQGDRFGAKDVNATNAAINALSSVKVTFPASGWSSSVPYTQTVVAPGVTETDNFGAPEIESTGNSITDRVNLTNLGYVSGGITGSGSVTLYCYEAKPTADLTVYLTRRSM